MFSHKFNIRKKNMLTSEFVISLLIILQSYPSLGCVQHGFENVSVVDMFGQPKYINLLAEPNVLPLISIKDTQITTLCPSVFSKQQFVTQIEMRNVQLEEIQPGAFEGLHTIIFMSFKSNNLREIAAGIFNNLHLQGLDLEDNKIESIAPNAFENMPNLNLLTLKTNKLSEINPNWFIGCPKLATLSLQDNLITTVPVEAFKLHDSEETAVILTQNRIRVIEERAFANFRRNGKILLNYNELSDLPENIFAEGKKHKYALYLDNNRFQCLPKKAIKNFAKQTYLLSLSNNYFNCRIVKLFNKLKGLYSGKLQLYFDEGCREFKCPNFK